MAKKFFSFVPNTITSLNVLSGSLSIVMAFNNQLLWAGGFILLAAFFDFFDGLSARLLNAYSAMGKELDSLADVISFGFAPAAIVHIFVKEKVLITPLFSDASAGQLILVFIPFFMVVFSALRLAKFNIDTRQTDAFIGLPTPANALVWASLPFILAFNQSPFIQKITDSAGFLLILAMVLSLLLVVEVPMFSLKFKNFSFQENKIRFVFLAGCLLLIAIFTLTSIPLIVIWYILLSIINNLVEKI